MPINANDGEVLICVQICVMVDIISEREDTWLGGLCRLFTNFTWHDVKMSLMENAPPDIYLRKSELNRLPKIGTTTSRCHQPAVRVNRRCIGGSETHWSTELLIKQRENGFNNHSMGEGIFPEYN